MSDEKVMREDLDEGYGQDPLLDAALRNFRQSVHAWSDAAYHEPRAIVSKASRRVARPWAMASVALGLMLAAGVAGVGVHERNRHIEEARLAAQKQAEQQRELAAERAKASENLLANVDRDISREVPSALEPLAQLMTDDNAQ